MDVDEEEHEVMGGAPPSDVDGTYDDASPRMRKKPRRKSVTASDAPQSTSRGGAAMPTLLSRLNSSSPAPISNAPSMKQTSTARKPQSGIGSPGMSINTRFSGGPIGVDGLGSAGDTSGIGSSSTVRTSANNSLFSRVHSASAGVGSDNAVHASALKASHPTTGGIMTTKGSAPGKKHGASKWREPLDASLPDDGMGLSILGASNIDADEIKIRGAAQRRGEDTGHAHGPGGGSSSLLARMGDSGEGGAPGKGDHSGDRKRKIRVGRG
ncbi:hypothetical protein DFH11DRAFT_1221987 [Phellopilus nigrolimitatus]|nr:hypothetical protein DFH11DRAFT_1221987 [Phellopilus nigrolimitatus]